MTRRPTPAPPPASLLHRLVTTTTHNRSYQLECPTCSSVALFHGRADLLQPQIDRIIPRTPFTHEPSGQLTTKQRGAVDWSSAITSCLRRGMALHQRCRVCTILMGPGHAEPGINGFCTTHSEIQLAPPVVRKAPTEVLAWIAAAGPHPAQIL